MRPRRRLTPAYSATDRGTQLTIVGLVVFWAARVYFYFLWGRVIIDLIAALKRGWKPKGFLLMLSVFLFAVTDPPVKALRKLVKPVRIGQVMLDLSVLILFIALIIIMNLATLLIAF